MGLYIKSAHNFIMVMIDQHHHLINMILVRQWKHYEDDDDADDDDDDNDDDASGLRMEQVGLHNDSIKIGGLSMPHIHYTFTTLCNHPFFLALYLAMHLSPTQQCQ